MSIRLYVCAIRRSFLGLSLALKSYDQLPGLSLVPLHPTWKLGNSVTRKLERFIFFVHMVYSFLNSRSIVSSLGKPYLILDPTIGRACKGMHPPLQLPICHLLYQWVGGILTRD